MLTENERLAHPLAAGSRMSSDGHVAHYWSPAAKRDLMERLGRYEDTGMTPEEIVALKREAVVTNPDLMEPPEELAGKIDALKALREELRQLEAELKEEAI